MSLILMAAIVVHLPLLLMKLPLKSYDTNFHIFFASHYVHHWFNPWNAKWYAGFSQTTYPPLPQQWVALLSHIIRFGHGLYGGAACRHFAAGGGRLSVFPALGQPARRIDRSPGERFSRLGELPGLFRGPVGHHFRGANLFERPAISVRVGPARQVGDRFSKRACFSRPPLPLTMPRCSLDHLLCGANPGAGALDREDGERISMPAFVGRTVAIAVVVGVAIALVLLPFWIALIHYPVTQTPIPHSSRANYILSPQWGLNYFIVPYGALVLALPFIFCAAPWLFGFVPCCLASGWHFCGPRRHNPGGPSSAGPRLRRADHGAIQLLGNFARPSVCGTFGRFARRSISYWAVVGLTTRQPAVVHWRWAGQPIGPRMPRISRSIRSASWLNRDGHDQYRYVTLGFGNKIARLAMMTDAAAWMANGIPAACCRS
jgi:hypothetical protein